MDKKEKKSNTYSLLKDLDKTVQRDKKKEPNSKSSNGVKRRRSRSPKRSSRSPKRSSRSPKRRSRSPKRSSRSPKRSYSPRRKGSSRKPAIIEEEKIDYDIPDRSNGDLYCQACDSHMNSEQMWDAHIRGKRHLKQIKKGEPEQKYDDLDEEPIIMPELNIVNTPLIGLQHCCEIRRLQGKPTYQCFMCSASISTSELLIEHVIGLKHRMAYLKEYDYDNYALIMKADLKKGMIEPVVEEYVQKCENTRGQGKLSVKVEKPKPKEPWYPPNPNKKASTSTNRKRPHPDDQFQKNKISGRRDSFDSERNEPRFEDSEWRNISDRDYPRTFSDSDQFSERDRESMWQHDRYERHEASFFRRSISPPSRSSEMKFTQGRDLQSVDTSSPWNKPDQASQYVDYRNVLENKIQSAESASNRPGALAALRSICEALPLRVFIELFFDILKRKTITDSELDIMTQLATYSVDMVAKIKLEKLPSDWHKTLQENLASSNLNQGSYNRNVQSEATINNVNVPAAIQNLLDSMKNQGSGSSLCAAAQPVYTNHEPAYSTQSSSSAPCYSLWGNPSNSKDSTAIPGLTVTGLQESSPEGRISYPGERYASGQSVWSPIKDTFNRY